MSLFPYPGLRPFKRDESYIFFGRDEQIDQLIDKLFDMRFISVIGLSGCGKSSLTRAGIIAALEKTHLDDTCWQVAEMHPGNRPLYNLAESLLTHASVGLKQANKISEREMLPVFLASLRSSPKGLIEILHETPLPERTNLLILVDQFEEIFRCHQEGGRDETEAFVALLLTSVQQEEIPIYVVLTMRSEFMGQCALFHELPEMINIGQFLTPRLNRKQQSLAITGPAGLFGGTIEPRLTNHLLNEMGNDPDQLPVLQHCLMRMWRHAMKRSGISEEEIKPVISGSPTPKITITLQDYEAVGELKEALSNHADEAFNEFTYMLL